VLIKLLLVEDEEDVIDLFVKYLNKVPDRYDITVARNFAEVQQLLAAESFEVVVTDFNFPGGNGDQVAALANQKNTPRIYLHSGTPEDAKSTLYTQRIEKLDRNALKALFF
jgi:CheY-like chemotaxis protein